MDGLHKWKSYNSAPHRYKENKCVGNMSGKWLAKGKERCDRVVTGTINLNLTASTDDYTRLDSNKYQSANHILLTQPEGSIAHSKRLLLFWHCDRGIQECE